MRTAKRMMDSFRKSIAEDCSKFKMGPNQSLRYEDDSYGYWCQHHTLLGLAEFALARNAEKLEVLVIEAAKLFLPYLHHAISVRRTYNKKDPQSWFDQASIADSHFASTFSLFIALRPRDEIVEICRTTNYGRYAGLPRIITPESRFMRMMRAYFLKDRLWLEDEIYALESMSVARDTRNEDFTMPKAKWHPHFEALFGDDEAGFQKSSHDILRWYRNRVKAPHLTTENGYRYSLVLNKLLLATLKVARYYQGYKVELDDEFVPSSLIRKKGTG